MKIVVFKIINLVEKELYKITLINENGECIDFEIDYKNKDILKSFTKSLVDFGFANSLIEKRKKDFRNLQWRF